MTGFTDTAARAALNSLVAAYPHVALFTAVGTDAGTGFTEVSAAGYSRFDATGLWNAAAGSAPASISNAADFTFGPAGADWGTALAVGLYTLSSGGVLGAWDYLGAFPWLPATIAVSSPAAITTDPTNGLFVNDACVYTTEYGGTLPTFSQSTLSGLLRVAHIASSVFDVTNNGLPVVTTSFGTGKIRKVATQAINPIVSEFTIDSGTFTITLA